MSWVVLLLTKLLSPLMLLLLLEKHIALGAPTLATTASIQEGGISPTHSPMIGGGGMAPPTVHSHAVEGGGSISNGTLDPSQAQALLSLGVIAGPDPCNTASHHTLICDQGLPYKHLVYLQLDYCTEDAVLPWSAWSNLSSLRALAFQECPAKLFQVPHALAHSLTSLTCIASLGRSVYNVLAPGLPAPWLGSFYNLLELSVSDVQVNSRSLNAILSKMRQLQHVSFSNTNLSGPLPSTWPSNKISLLHLPGNDFHGLIPSSLIELSELESLDLSSNNLKGGIPEELGQLQNLQYLSLASNQLTGPIPNLIQNLTSLLYIDLSNNQFNGSIPTFFTGMPNLRYVDLRTNNLGGEVPFTEGYLRSLNSFKLGGNPGLCYDKSIISARFVEGVQPCVWMGAGPAASPSYLYPSPSPEPDPFKGVSLQHGAKMVVIVIALALACTMGAILSAILLSRHCPSSKG